MLDWFVSAIDADKAVNHGELIDEEAVETRPEKIPNCCIDENVNVYHVKKYFTVDAWKIVLQVLDWKKTHSNWSCKVCDQDLDGKIAIACDSCLDWYHLHCIGLRNAPKRKEWFCRSCHAQASQNNGLD